MGLLFNKKATNWALGLQQWCVQQEKIAGPETPRAVYLFGVIVAVNQALRRSRFTTAQLEATWAGYGDQAHEAAKGYSDGMGLLGRVFQQQRIPTRDYGIVLAEPYSAQII